MTERKSGVASKELQAARRLKRHRQVMRNRIIFAAACLLVLILIIFIVVKLISAIAGGSKETAEVSTLTFTAAGQVVFEEITDFDEEVYDKSDLKDYTEGLIESYNETDGSEAIVLDKFSVKDDTAYMKTTYADADTYTAFTSYIAYCDTVENAAEAGYDFADTFDEVVDGTKGATTDYDSASDFSGLSVAILKQNVVVKVPGDIVYVSDRSTSIEAADTVSITPADGNEDAADLVYIIFSNADDEQ